MNKRTKIIIVTVIAVLLIIASLVVFYVKKNNESGTRGTDKPDVSITTDKDTGEQITTDPSLPSSESQDSVPIILFGLADLIDAATLTTQQSDFVKDQLTIYGTTNLKSKYSTLTIKPQDTKINGDSITSTVRLGDTDQTVAIKFLSGNESGTMQLFITDPLNTGGGSYTSPTEQVYAD